MTLIGVIEDNLLFLISNVLHIGLCTHTNLLAYPQGAEFCPIKSSQPVLEILNHILAFFVDPLILFPGLVFVGLLISWLVAFRIYSRVFPRFTSALLALTFLLSPYFAYHSKSHVELVYVGLALLVLDLFIFDYSVPSKKRALLGGFLLAFTMGVSNYLGYFTLLLLIPLGTIKFLSTPRSSRGALLYSYVLLGISTAVFGALFLLPYFSTYLATFFPGLNSVAPICTPAFGAIQRPLEDFFVFSSRPWYFFLPSPENPFIGTVASATVSFLQDSLHLWLASNYFPSEHSASFLGCFNLVLGLGGILIFIKHRMPLDKKTQFVFWSVLATLGFLIILMMPPFVTVRGYKLFFPSFVLFKLFPMFRVLARLGVFVLFFWLFFVGIALTYLQNNLNSFWFKFILGLWFIGNALTMFVPLRFTYVGSPPQVFTYLASNSQPQDALAVYPFKMALSSTFWIRVYKRPLVNPRGVYVSAEGTRDLTASLATPKGLAYAQRLGTRYLVYFPLADSSSVSTLPFFDTSPLLHRVGVFDPGDAQFGFLASICSATHLCRYDSYGSSPQNMSILYEFTPKVEE